eukprot:717891-Hanusia_phi.AAC.2
MGIIQKEPWTVFFIHGSMGNMQQFEVRASAVAAVLMGELRGKSLNTRRLAELLLSMPSVAVKVKSLEIIMLTHTTISLPTLRSDAVSFAPPVLLLVPSRWSDGQPEHFREVQGEEKSPHQPFLRYQHGYPGRPALSPSSVDLTCVKLAGKKANEKNSNIAGIVLIGGGFAPSHFPSKVVEAHVFLSLSLPCLSLLTCPIASSLPRLASSPAWPLCSSHSQSR